MDIGRDDDADDGAVFLGELIFVGDRLDALAINGSARGNKFDAAHLFVTPGVAAS